MSQAEQNYDIYDKELLAVVNTLEHWRVYTESSSELTILRPQESDNIHNNQEAEQTTSQIG